MFVEIINPLCFCVVPNLAYQQMGQNEAGPKLTRPSGPEILGLGQLGPEIQSFVGESLGYNKSQMLIRDLEKIQDPFPLFGSRSISHVWPGNLRN